MKRKRNSKSPERRGIPADVDQDELRRWVASRVSEVRLKHIDGVVAVGEQLSLELSIDPLPVRLACLLHDCCKEIRAVDLVREAKKRGLKVSKMEEDNGHILHGPVGALVVRDQLDITNKDVLSAIAEHTLGSTTMSVVSKVVYLADSLEEARGREITDPIWEALGTTPLYDRPLELEAERIGRRLDLDRAMLVASDLMLRKLLAKGKLIHIRAVKVRNHFLKRVQRKEQRSAGKSS